MLGSSTGYTLAFYSSLGASIFGCDCLIVRISWRLGVLFLRPARPVRGHLLLLVFCTVFCTIFLPYLAPEEPVTGPNGKNSKRTVLAPLKIFVPTRQTVDGVTKRDFNLFFRGAGSFFSVLATGYVPMALQLGGTNVFAFQPAKTGGMLVSRTQNNLSWWQADSAPTVAHPPRPRLLPIPLLPAHHHPWPAIHLPLPERALHSGRTAPGLADGSHAIRRRCTSAQADRREARIRLRPLLSPLLHLHRRHPHRLRESRRARMASLCRGLRPALRERDGPAAKGVVLDLVRPEERAEALGGIALIEKLG